MWPEDRRPALFTGLCTNVDSQCRRGRAVTAASLGRQTPPNLVVGVTNFAEITTLWVADLQLERAEEFLELETVFGSEFGSNRNAEVSG